MIKFNCSKCDKKIGIPGEYAGKLVRCPRCKQPARVPELELEPIDEFVANSLITDDLDSQDESPDFPNLLDYSQPSQPGHAPASQPAPQPSSPWETAGPKIPCPKCNRSVPADSEFCVLCGSPMPTPQPQMSQPSQRRSARNNYDFAFAGFWRRFAAIILDGFVLSELQFAVTKGLEAIGNPLGVFDFSGIIVTWLYFAISECSDAQATFGKRALGIIVTDLNGNKVSFGRASGRHFAKIISAFTLLIGYLMAAFTSQKQTLHDKIAGCLVIQK